MRKRLIATCMVFLVLLTSCADVQSSKVCDTTDTATVLEIEDSIGTICDATDILDGSYETAEEAETETFVETTSDSATMKGTANTTGQATETTESVDETTREEATVLAEITETESEKIEETTGAAEAEKTEKTVETTAETRKMEETTTVSTTTAETTPETTEKTTTEAETTVLETDAEVWLDLVRADGNVSEETLTQANAILQTYVPKWLLDAFVDSGWRYYVVDYDIATEYYFYRNKGREYGSIHGLTYYLEKKCYVEDDSKGLSTVLHEFGHFFDWYAGIYIDGCNMRISSTDEFEEIYENEAEIFKSAFNYSHYSYSVKEFFAEAFKMYLTDAEKLASNCPKTYELMARCLNG